MNKNRKSLPGRGRGENGQALAELVVCLVGIAIVFLGFLLIADMSYHGIENYLEARRQADSTAAATASRISPDGIAILDWEAGGDGLRHTGDDVAVGGTWEDPTFFQVSPVPGIPPEIMPLVSGELGSTFLNAANLVEGSASRVLPHDDEYMSSDMIFFLIRRHNITTVDRVYMPGILQ